MPPDHGNEASAGRVMGPELAAASRREGEVASHGGGRRGSSLWAVRRVVTVVARFEGLFERSPLE